MRAHWRTGESRLPHCFAPYALQKPRKITFFVNFTNLTDAPGHYKPVLASLAPSSRLLSLGWAIFITSFHSSLFFIFSFFDSFSHHFLNGTDFSTPRVFLPAKFGFKRVQSLRVLLCRATLGLTDSKWKSEVAAVEV